MKKIIILIVIVFIFNNNILFAQQSKEISSFFQNIRKNYISNVEKKMKSGFNTDGMIGVVALYNAKTPEMYRVLIENGLKLDGIYGSLALIDAINKGDLESVKILIDNGADLNIRAFITDDIKKEITSLSEQDSEKAKTDSKNFQSFYYNKTNKLLGIYDYDDYIDHHTFLNPKEGGIPDTPFTYVLRPLYYWAPHWPSMHELSKEEEKYYLDLMDLMLESKKVDFTKTIYLDLNKRERFISVLQYAIIVGSDMVQKFIEAGAPVYQAGSFYDTALTFALRMKYIEKSNQSIRDIKNDEINYLIKVGADVNSKNGVGYFPLLFAVQYHDLDMAELLIKAGADTNLRSEGISFDTMISNADMRKKERIETFGNKVNYITEKTILIELAKSSGNGEMVNTINAQKVQYGYSTLYYAVKDNDLEITKLLLDNGAKLDDDVKQLLPRAVPDIQRLFKY